MLYIVYILILFWFETRNCQDRDKKSLAPLPLPHATFFFSLFFFSFLTKDIILSKQQLQLVKGLFGHDCVELFKVDLAILIIVSTFDHFQKLSIRHGLT